MVYTYFDGSGDPIYVGMTGCFWQRDYQHRLQKSWRHFAVSALVSVYANERIAAIAEAETMRSAQPAFNKRIPNRWAECAAPYLDAHGGLTVKFEAWVCLNKECAQPGTTEIARPVSVWGTGHTKIEP